MTSASPQKPPGTNLSTRFLKPETAVAERIDQLTLAHPDEQDLRQSREQQASWEPPRPEEWKGGFDETAQNLGFTYEPVQSIHDANFRIWFDSWAHHCKWLTAYAFVSLDPNPHTLGSQTGDVHLCKFTTPLTGRRPADYSIVAHEVAHIFAAQPRFGDGLMAEGGNGAERFTEHELDTMRNKINVFRYSIEPK